MAITFLFVNGVRVGAGQEFAVQASSSLKIVRVERNANGTRIDCETAAQPQIEPITWLELDLARAGKRISAIKAVRERTSCGLREAKDAVDRAVPPPAPNY